MNIEKYLKEGRDDLRLLKLMGYKEPNKCCGFCTHYDEHPTSGGGECQNDAAFERVWGGEYENEYPRVDSFGVCKYYEE